MYYVYRFLNKEDEVIYIGYTNNLKNRISSHFSKKGHLSKGCYLSVGSIEYFEFQNSVEAKLFEAQYISLIKPLYNIEYKNFRCNKYKDISSNIEWKIFDFNRYLTGENKPREHNKDLIDSNFIEINKDYFIQGVNDIFVGKNTKEMKVIVTILSKLNTYKIEEDGMIRCSIPVSEVIMGKNVGRDLKCIQGILEKSSDIITICLSECKKLLHITLNSIIYRKSSTNKKNIIYVDDFLKTKSKVGALIKLLIYSKINSCKDTYMETTINTATLTNWSDCGKEISKYVRNGLISINSENDSCVNWEVCKHNNLSKVLIKFNKKEFVEHIKANKSIKPKNSKVKIIEVKM